MFRLLAFYGVAVDDAFTEPWETVDNPSRAKASSLRAQELMEVFASLGDQEQKVVMQVARLAKKSMGKTARSLVVASWNKRLAPEGGVAPRPRLGFLRRCEDAKTRNIAVLHMRNHYQRSRRKQSSRRVTSTAFLPIQSR